MYNGLVTNREWIDQSTWLQMWQQLRCVSQIMPGTRGLIEDVQERRTEGLVFKDSEAWRSVF